ncbi:FHIPEP family type III secretion protein [Anaerocolumna sp. AGMB13025]|uniref:FHIPEP family type III secretion protein n=1 Tax=Anaerocolumna sp. AGMB13025 TaxID=3039116 RepID=UPI00241D3DC1|nr:FHIPEP family type III secretion protein [Anaerocolumna sp. AGMB13025]WFR58559.1 FHIPEP family type III secretion protein [Anaerocolumna sp. AGMB13025]
MSIYGFDERLANARRDKGLTQEELAAKLGVTPQAVSKWERSTSYPDVVMLSSICDMLDCSMDYLLNGKLAEVKLTESGDETARKQLLNKLIADPLILEVGEGLIDLLLEEQKEGFKGVADLRERMALKYGVLLPVVRLRDAIELKKYEYRILTYDWVLLDDTLKEEEERSFARLMNQLEEICRCNYSRIINKQMVKSLVDNLEEHYPAVVKGVIPEKISLMQLQEIIGQIIERGGSVHNLIKIIEFLEGEAAKRKNSSDLAEAVLDYLKQ